jgi:hypothetical protein
MVGTHLALAGAAEASPDVSHDDATTIIGAAEGGVSTAPAYGFHATQPASGVRADADPEATTLWRRQRQVSARRTSGRRILVAVGAAVALGGLAALALVVVAWLSGGSPPKSPPLIVEPPRADQSSPEPPTQPAVPDDQKQAPVQVGSLAITSKVAGVTVWLHDQKIGETRPGRALVASDLAAGTYRLKAGKVGHRDWELTVAVAAGERREIEIDLQPLAPPEPAKQAGSLVITSKVAGVEVWLDDRKIGETRPGQPLIANDLSPGTYRLKASKPGHREWRLRLAVVASQQREVRSTSSCWDPR